MNGRIIIAIIAVPILAFLSTWLIASLFSDSKKVQRRAGVAEVFLWFAILAIYAKTAQTSFERKLIFFLIAGAAGVWLFRGVRLLQSKGRAKNT